MILRYYKAAAKYQGDSEKAAHDIFKAIQKGPKIAYVPSWWAPLMWLVIHVPEWVYHWGYRRHLAWDNAPPKA